MSNYVSRELYDTFSRGHKVIMRYGDNPELLREVEDWLDENLDSIEGGQDGRQTMKKDKFYEAEKRRLQELNLTYEEYEEALKKWCAEHDY